MNYGNSADQEMPTTSGIAIKQEIKEELDDYNELSETLTDKKDNFDGVEMKFEAEDETFIDNGFEESCNNYSDHDSEDEPKILLKCDICSKEYQTKECLFRHRKYLHKLSEQQQFKCSKCNYKTLIKQKCLRHVKIHDKKNHLKCHFCKYTAVHLQTLNAHIFSRHKLENKGENKIKITSKIHQCAKCLYSTIQKGNLTTHMKIHNKIKSLKCLFCEYKTYKKQHLDNHILSKHSNLLNESNQNLITSKIHCCQLCNYKTTLASNLSKHFSYKH